MAFALLAPEPMPDLPRVEEEHENGAIDAILALEAMQIGIEELGAGPASRLLLRPACSSENGVAFPGRRMVQTAKAFEDRGIVRSICGGDFSLAMDAVSGAIAQQLNRAQAVGCEAEDDSSAP